MTEVLTGAGFSPESLGLKADNSEHAAVIERLAEITKLFQDLRLPFFALPEEKAKILWPHQEGVPVKEPDDYPPDFEYGVDYEFGQYQGKPVTAAQNAEAAWYHGNKSVPIWAILKSVAYGIPGTDHLVFVHLRGDRKVDEAKVAKLVGFPNLDKLPVADEETQLKPLGLENGTVNPLVADSPKIEHLFDRDLVAGADYPESDFVFTSSGNKGYFVRFNIRRFIVAKSGMYASWGGSTSEISEPGPKRIVAKRPVFIIGGDSLDDAVRYSQIIGRDITNKLLAEHQYYGDQSHTHVRVISDPELAGSIDTNLYGASLQAHMRRKVIPSILRDSKEISQDAIALAAYGSYAMEGLGILDEVEGIEPVYSRTVVEGILAILRREHVSTAYTLLIGLSSAYDEEHSAFKGKILEGTPKVSKGFVNSNIQPLVTELKQRNIKDAKRTLYNIFERMLRGAESTKPSSLPDLQGLKDKTVIAILGISEFENYVNDDWTEEEPEPAKNQTRPDFLIIRSNDPNVISEEIAKARADKDQRKKIRVVLISPKRAVSQTITQKTLGLIA